MIQPGRRKKSGGLRACQDARTVEPAKFTLMAAIKQSYIFRSFALPHEVVLAIDHPHQRRIDRRGRVTESKPRLTKVIDAEGHVRIGVIR